MGNSTFDIEDIRKKLEQLPAIEKTNYGQLQKDIETFDRRLQEDKEHIQKYEQYRNELTQRIDAENHARIEARNAYWATRTNAHRAEDKIITSAREKYWAERASRHTSENKARIEARNEYWATRTKRITDENPPVSG